MLCVFWQSKNLLYIEQNLVISFVAGDSLSSLATVLLNTRKILIATMLTWVGTHYYDPDLYVLDYVVMKYILAGIKEIRRYFNCN